jgi:ParB-like chromosome segregation protein Spo0J
MNHSELFAKLRDENITLDEKVEIINSIKLELHELSPFKTEPVDCVLWVKNESIFANDYNPNAVASPEMELLKLSIEADGYTQPIVTMDEESKRTVIDGFHRNRVGKEYDSVRNRIHGYLPVVTINKDREDRSDRMAATIRHNRARGEHKVESMSNIIIELKKRRWSDEKIAKELGMDADEVLRLAQIT